MLVQIDDLPQYESYYDGADGWMERDREVLEEEELLEREYLQDDGEEDDELEKQVVMIISFQHVFLFILFVYCTNFRSLSHAFVLALSILMCIFS